MRLPVIEDNPDGFPAKLKYFLEPAADAQKRFDEHKEDWDRFPFRKERVYPWLHNGYYLIHDNEFFMLPMPPPIWFYKKNLRQDQIDYLEDLIRFHEKQRQEEKMKTDL